ncbi:calumenin [Phtheirospermum japonicum]|uniref:Calumenin n=1 Tax=Phtheirospermum japonicum TaxID=374723 RepID=A0A830D5R6_9LAMI|nr:calumenin [Phtheirospermum japonicum]
MGKFSVIIYITLAIALLLLVSRSSNNNRSHGGHRHRRLRIRSNFTFTPPADPHRLLDRSPPVSAAFDPVVADIERKREDKEWEHHYFQTHHPEFHSESTQSAPGHESPPEWEDFMDAEDYLNDEEKFNVTNRLVILFPKIDVDPADGYLSEGELTQWNLQQSQKEVMHRTEREMEVHDKNKDGFISFSEYEPPSWAKNSGQFSLFLFFPPPGLHYIFMDLISMCLVSINGFQSNTIFTLLLFQILRLIQSLLYFYFKYFVSIKHNQGYVFVFALLYLLVNNNNWWWFDHIIQNLC